MSELSDRPMVPTKYEQWHCKQVGPAADGNPVVVCEREELLGLLRRIYDEGAAGFPHWWPEVAALFEKPHATDCDLDEDCSCDRRHAKLGDPDE